MNIGIVLATYNEELNIKELVNLIVKNVDEAKIVIIDDSPERTIEGLVRNFKNIVYIYRGKKLGRGSAVLEGMKEILSNNNIDTIIEIDTDLSHDPSEIPLNLKKFRNENLDLLISSRYIKDSKILNWSLNRKIMSILANFLAKKTLKVPVSDYTNGYRIYSKKAAKHVIKNCGAIGDGFIILSEILVELYYSGFKISEIKTIWKNRVKGKSTVDLKEITASLIGLMRIYKKIDQIKHKNLK